MQVDEDADPDTDSADNSDANPDPNSDPAYHFNADPGLSFNLMRMHPDTDPQHWATHLC
jgi:hypothetical protein